MPALFQEILDSLPTDTPAFAEVFLLALLLSFFLGQVNAWCYMGSHRGVSYSRTFTQSLVLICMISSMSMSFVRLNPLVAIGLLGGMAIIRFRTVVRDARDTVYLLLSLVCGMAAGFGFHEAAVIGCFAANAVSLYMHRIGFGAWHSKDGMLRFRIPADRLDSPDFPSTLKTYCRRWKVLSVDESPSTADEGLIDQCAYTVRLRDSQRGPELVAAIREGFQVSSIHLLANRENEEVS